MARVVEGINGLKELVGEHLGYSDWIDIDQGRVNTFADATGDHQWIHVDPERAAKESPFGGPIAHGYLTMSLGPMLFPQIKSVNGIKMGVYYGCGTQLASVEDIPGGAQVTMVFTFECEGAPKPSCVSEVIFRYYE